MEKLELDKYWKHFPPVLDPKIPYFTFPDLDVHKELVLPTLEKNSLSIIDGSLDNHDPKYIQQLLIEYNINDKVIILTSNFGDYTKCNNIIFCPYQYFRSKFYYKKFPIKVKKYKVSCINRNPKAHKLYTYYKLCKHHDFENMMTSFYVSVTNDYPNETIDLNNWRFVSIPEIIKLDIVKNNINLNKLAFLTDDITSFSNVLNNNFHPAFSDSYLNVVTETSDSVPCISEKTFKPIISGQFFLLSSDPKLIECLEWFGFDCFNDIFLNHEYKSKSYFIDRIDRLMEILFFLYDDIDKLYFLHANRIRENQKYFSSSNLFNKIVEPLRQAQILDKSYK